MKLNKETVEFETLITGLAFGESPRWHNKRLWLVYFDGGQGIIALVTPDGSIRQVADGIAFPKGMAITSDNSTLIIAESFGKRLTSFEIAINGKLLNRRVWFDLIDGVPDGICIDKEGAVWYGDVPNKRCVRFREGGEVLQTINLDRGCFACMLGVRTGERCS